MPIGGELSATSHRSAADSEYLSGAIPGDGEDREEYIAAGDIFQVVLSQRVDVASNVHPFTVYRALRTINPSPYMFYLDFVDHQIVGASPSSWCDWKDGTVANHPIAGTRPRGATPEEDEALRATSWRIRRNEPST